MTETVLYSIGDRIIAAIAGALRFACRFLVLSLALVCYGSVPSTPTTQTETESQLQEEIASSGCIRSELKARLRGAAHRRAGIAVVASSDELARRIAASQRVIHISPRVPLGLALPLRC
jgi:hypothetical protein